MSKREPNPGAEQLARWLARHGAHAAQLARALGVSPQAVSQWLSGATRPDEVLRLVLERVTKGAVTRWDWWGVSERARYHELTERANEWLQST